MALRRQQLLLTVDPTAVAAKRSVAADHAVTRDEHADVVVAVRRSDGANRLRRSDRSRDLGIASRLPGRDLAQLAPHSFLEGRAGDVDRKVWRGERPFDRDQGPLDQLAKTALVLDQRGFGEQPLERL